MSQNTIEKFDQNCILKKKLIENTRLSISTLIRELNAKRAVGTIEKKQHFQIRSS